MLTLLAVEARERYDRAEREAIQGRSVGGLGPGSAARIDVVSGAAWPCADRYPDFCPQRNTVSPTYANLTATRANRATTRAIQLSHRVARRGGQRLSIGRAGSGPHHQPQLHL